MDAKLTVPDVEVFIRSALQAKYPTHKLVYTNKQEKQ
jgi:hypothetical protein